MCFPLLDITASSSTKFEIEIQLLFFHKSKIRSLWEPYSFSSVFANKRLSKSIVNPAVVMLLTLWAQISPQCGSDVILPGPTLPSYPAYLPFSLVIAITGFFLWLGNTSPQLTGRLFCFPGAYCGDPLFTSAYECKGVSPHCGIIPDSGSGVLPSSPFVGWLWGAFCIQSFTEGSSWMELSCLK